MSRRFPIPLAPLTLMLGAPGCSSADLLGRWAIVDLDQEGTAFELPYTYDGIENGQPVTVTQGIRLIFDADGTGAWQTYYDYAYEDGSTVEDPFDYETAWKNKGSRTFQVQSSGGIDLDMDCTLDEDRLDCEGDKDGGPIVVGADRLDP